MIDKAISHYRIIEQLGAGGMGVVYRARDERLERDVALKVLPEGSLASDESRRRFQREARALSRLNHPNIAIVHEFDSREGSDFLVMELVSGATLAERLQSGPLAEKETVTLGTQIAEALEAAHEQGVTHRDLKPANIVVTPKGQIKLLDFGLARFLRSGVDEGLAAPVTAPQTMMGTLTYMAPEQLLGRPTDSRADIFALGVLLYEMATGRLPYRETLSTALIYEIVNTSPPPPGRMNPDLSPRLEEVILKALEKDPGRRYQSAREMAVDLGRTSESRHDKPRSAPAEARPRIESLAVLPLENLSGDPEQEFFADGMTEALIADLAQIGSLRVISRTSAMLYKGVRKPLPEIARALNVDAIVEGSVLRLGNRVRITAQLIEAATDRHLWAKSYERPVDDVLTLQCDVARAIADEVRIKLSPQEETRLAKPRSLDPAAFEAYLRGRHFWNKRNPTDLKKSLEYFNQAIDLDPTYALAYAGFADACNILGDLNVLPPRESAAKARAAATKALELDSRLGEAHTSLGFVYMFYDFDAPRAEEQYRRALDLSPNYATGHQWYSEYLTARARPDEAIAEGRRAEELDPLSHVIGTTLGDGLYYARRYGEAIAQLRRVIEIAPDFLYAHMDLARALTQTGRHEEAIAEFKLASTLGGNDPDHSPGLGHAYALAGRRDDAARILVNLIERSKETYVSPYSIATVFTGLGDIDHAFEWLEAAYHKRDRALVWLEVHPRLDPLRADARFADLTRRVGFWG